MRKLFLILGLLSFAVIAAEDKEHAVIKTELHCFKLKALASELKDKYGEEPMLVGKSELEEGTVTIVYANPNTGTYTVIGANKDVACIFDTGNGVRFRMPKMLESKML